MNKLLLLIIFMSVFTYGKEISKAKKYWSPPSPVFSQQFDWLKLNSGEWLKGDIISMYDDELEFDSKEFNNLTFDWEDVQELRSRFDQQIRFDNGEVKQGFLTVKENHVILISDGNETYYPLSELLSITSSADERVDLWDGKFSLGVDIKSGNTNQLDYLASFYVQRRTPFTRFKVDFIYNYSKSITDTEDTVITDTSRLESYLDWYYSSDIFFRMIDYEYYSDLQQNIEARHTLGLSAGYHLIKNKRTQWEIIAGPSFQSNVYHNTTAEENQTSLVLALNTLFEYSFSSRLDYIFDYQIQFVEENSGKRNSYLKTGIEFDVRHDFDFELMLYVDRVAEPVATVNTLAPEPNDVRLIVGFGYDF